MVGSKTNSITIIKVKKESEVRNIYFAAVIILEIPVFVASLYLFKTFFLYSTGLDQSAAAKGFSGLSLFGSPSKD